MCTRMDQGAMDLKIIPYSCFKFISTSPDLYNLVYRIMSLCKYTITFCERVVCFLPTINTTSRDD